ncbi:MAG TPA: hypothetical protein VFN91_19700 [Myxococcaceae bacterium]|nr:hypothetical protein [Myxococcaceae bacterium]
MLLCRVVDYLRRYSSDLPPGGQCLGFARLFFLGCSTLPGTLFEGLAKLRLEDIKLYLYRYRRWRFFGASAAFARARHRVLTERGGPSG